MEERKKITSLPKQNGTKPHQTKDIAGSKFGVKTERLQKRNSHFTKEPGSLKIVKWKL